MTPDVELRRRFELAAGTVDTFRRDGHVLVPGLLAPDTLAPYRRAITSTALRLSGETRPLADRDTYSKAFLQVTNLWEHDPAVAEFVLAPRFADVAARLLGVARLRLYHDQALFKEPGGGRTPWHQDALYWPLDGARCITMWMPLVDLRPEMGGLLFGSGTNHHGALSDETISDESDAAFASVLGDGHRISAPVAPMAGDASFHLGWTAHKALPNESGTLREVMTVIWFADGLVVEEPAFPAQAHDLRTWIPGGTPGRPAGSRRNPVIEPVMSAG